MTINNAIFSRLTGFAGLSALVSARIYPVNAPQDASMPYVTYQRISNFKIGLLGTDTDISEPRYQIDVYSASYVSCRDVADQVVLAMQRWQGIEAGVTVLDTTIENDSDLYDNELLTYNSSVDVIISHRGQ